MKFNNSTLSLHHVPTEPIEYMSIIPNVRETTQLSVNELCTHPH